MRHIDWVETNGLISSTEEEALTPNATVYPNPFKHSLNVQFKEMVPGGITAELFAVNGQLIRKQYFTSNQRIVLEVGELPSGTFVLRLRSELGQVLLLRKVIRE